MPERFRSGAFHLRRCTNILLPSRLIQHPARKRIGSILTKNTTAGAATVRSTLIKQNHADTALDMSNRMMSRNVRRVPGQLVMGGIMKINR